MYKDSLVLLTGGPRDGVVMSQFAADLQHLFPLLEEQESRLMRVA